MSTTVKSKKGDSFESLSRQNYGTENYASNIQKANPGLSDPIPSGQNITIPDIPDAPTDAVSPSGNLEPNELALRINGYRFRHYTDISITRSIDSLDQCQVSAPFDAEEAKLKINFRPFQFVPVTVEIGSEILFSGTSITSVPTLGQSSSTIEFGAYAKPGVLNDCTAPSSALPLEFLNITLQDIASQLCEPFGIKVIFKDSPGNPFKKVACEPDSKILSFLSDLAVQRNLVISSSEKGELIFQKSIEEGKAVANLKQGRSPLLSVSPGFNQQNYFSAITGIATAKVGDKGSKYTMRNLRLAGDTRPFTFKLEDNNEQTLQEAVESKMGRMFGDTVTYSVELSTWRDESGNLFKPNTMIFLEAPDAMVYSNYKFLIRRVNLKRSATEETASLDLVLIGSLSGKIPEKLPWDE